ncbi:hypothetical protein ACVVIH_07750 [Chryseobacterium arthrosphaerae]|uniref:hypothetical protein n=1 Tax=Chryseobacterium arthrosphaerae TaxID=651561 RepID=UPI003D3350F7
MTGVTKNGIADYDTKIDAKRFGIVVHNYAFKLDDGSTYVALDYGDNGTNDKAQGAPEVMSFVSNGTWHLKASFTNSVLVKYTNFTPTAYDNFNVEFYIVAYRDLISKSNIPDTTVDLGGTNGSTKSLIPPSGF